jgi:hypothetical protein
MPGRVESANPESQAGADVRSVAPVAYVPIATATTFTYTDPTRLDITGLPTTQSISIPTLAYQITFPGGDTQAVLNAEYRIPIAGPVTFAFFTDVGTVGIVKRDQLALNSTNFASLSAQFPGSALSPTLPIAANTNFHLRSSGGVELVVNLPVLNAPFRLYWSYNMLRLAQQIVAPTSVFNIPTSVKQGLPFDTYESQILPQIDNFNGIIAECADEQSFAGRIAERSGAAMSLTRAAAPQMLSLIGLPGVMPQVAGATPLHDNGETRLARLESQRPI